MFRAEVNLVSEQRLSFVASRILIFLQLHVTVSYIITVPLVKNEVNLCCLYLCVLCNRSAVANRTEIDNNLRLYIHHITSGRVRFKSKPTKSQDY
jgi:hypothetical protein